ncbi:MAG: hypothetical protein KF875_10400 [Trueperaceae bacterium]|nr:hypothetical protein [Trueperaceae bacterium]MCO5175173.1 glycoside hydrolase family 15 protein [Trueperaceae bacterium]MCW5818857.1 hypothetical protein [Trueperaceae bacterium]
MSGGGGEAVGGPAGAANDGRAGAPDGGSGVGVDVALILGAQDPGGAYPAGPSFSQYQQCWLRDGAFIAHALDRVGEHGSVARFHAWVARCLEPLAPYVRELRARREAGDPITEFEFLPARFTLAGAWLKDGWPNFQLDGYGQWLWSLAGHLRATGSSRMPAALVPAVAVAVDYLEAFWNEPCYDSWEEHRSQLHTATLASIAAGLRDIAVFVPASGLATRALRVHAAVLAFIEAECVQDGAFVKYVRNPAVDASLLWLATPFDLVSPSDARMARTVARIERELLGGGLRRYAADTYYGGGEWVLLTAWLAWHRRRLGDEAGAARLLAWVEAHRGADGALPEQVPGADCHPYFFEYWTRNWGESAGPLLWSHAMAVVARLG